MDRHTERRLWLKIGYIKDKLTVDFLALTDDLTLLTPSVEGATRQLCSFNHTAAKVGLRVAIYRTEFIAKIRDAPDSIPLVDAVIGKTTPSNTLGNR